MKKILLLAPTFYGYYKEIETEIKNRGYKVDVILENFSDKSNMYRFFYVKHDRAKKKFTRKYYINEFAKLDNGYDYIVVIRGEALSKELLSILKINNTNAYFVMYQWDSVKNNPISLEIKDYFDVVYTFDKRDAKKYGWIYRPLFYIEKTDDIKIKKELDFSFIGTLYYRRAILLKKMKEYCRENDNSLFDFIYSPKIVYLLHRFVMHDKRYSILNEDEVQFLPMDNKTLKNKYAKTRILVDYTPDDQSGLTMRTIESLGYDCKLITNNTEIKNTDIYRYGNVFVYNIENFYIPKEFVSRKYNKLPDDIMYYYSLNGWIDCILNKKGYGLDI